MNFPKRIKQHKNESDSFAIILYKLKEIGIFRNVTESDYGIDFEIEVVNGDKVDGHCIKVQIKTKEVGLVRTTDKHATVGGIKQSTLNYWAELSYSTPIVAMAVNLEDDKEKIYVSEPLFWQAISLLDGAEEQKEENGKKKSIPTKTIDIGDKCDDQKNIERLRRIAYDYSLRDFLYAHKWMLRNINKVYDMFADTATCDPKMEIYEPDLFLSFLENAKILLNDEKVVRDSFDTIFSYQYYKQQSNYDEPYNIHAYCGMKYILPPLIIVMDKYKKRILASTYYWVNKDPNYLKLVFSIKIPSHNSIDELKKYCCNHYHSYDSIDNDDFFSFIAIKAKEYGLREGDMYIKCQ